MIETGRGVTVAYLTDDFVPTTKAKATLVKVMYADGRMKFGRRVDDDDVKKYSPDQDRDDHGRFADEGGGNSAVDEEPGPKLSREEMDTLKPGTRVIHRRFGPATVVGRDGDTVTLRTDEELPAIMHRDGSRNLVTGRPLIGELRSVKPIKKYSEDQLRDEHGRFAYEGGAGGMSDEKPLTEEYKAELREYGKDQRALTPFDTDEIKGARRLQATQQHTLDIQTPEREKLRERVAKKLYGKGAKTQGHEAWIVLGPPAAGKSKVFADPIAKKNGAMILDSDNAKRMLPEFQGGRNAGAVHEEAAQIADERVFKRAVLAGDNLVLPRVGKTLKGQIELAETLKAAGYKVHLLYNDLPPEKAAARAAKRFLETGRFVDPHYVLNIVGTKPRETYDALKKHPAIADYAAYSNDVAKGEPAVFLERGERAARQTRRHSRGRSYGTGLRSRQTRLAAARLVEVTKLGGQDHGPLDEAMAGHILRMAGIGDWDELARILVRPIGEAAAQGVLYGFADLGMDENDPAFNLANQDAVTWAADRAAELVGRRRVGAGVELVHNAPPWAITESTRDGLRELVVQALAEGWSAQKLQAEVTTSWIFDAARAEMIARTELAMAHVAGTMAAWKRSGVVNGKRSLMSDLHDQDDICDINAEAGVIALDGLFPSGDDGPPYHPRCECVLVAEMVEETADADA